VNIQRESMPHILWSLPDRDTEVDCACAVEDASVLWDVSEPPEGDCACSTPAAPTETCLVRADGDWLLAPALYRAPLPDAHELVFNPVGPAGPVVLNQPARAILDAYRHPHPLMDGTARQLAALQLLTPIRNPQSAIRNPKSAIRDPQPTLTAWLHVTNACNLRCAYCYLDKTGEAMTEEVGRAAVDAVFRSAQANGFGAVKLKYAGGEPSLNFDLVRTLHEYARHKASRAGLQLRAVMLSNGVALMPKMLDWLRDENVRLMISLDGVGSAHDAQRTFINGRGTFDLVARNVDRALARGLTPHLSITVTARNAEQLADAVAFALERDLPFNLNFFRDNECVATAADLAGDHVKWIAGIKAAFAVIEANLPRRRLIDGLMDRSTFDGPHEYPCGAGRNYMVINQRGCVARCQMEMSRAATDVLADDPLSVIRAHAQGLDVPVDEKESCRDCAWRYWCAGGCPLLTYRATGRSDVPSPYCAVYKALYPDVLRLEGLRLLKWSAPVD